MPPAHLEEAEGEIIFRLPRVEVYEIQGGGARTLLYTGSAAAEAVAGQTSAVSGTFGVRLRAGRVSVPLQPGLCVLEPAPGVFLFSAGGAKGMGDEIAQRRPATTTAAAAEGEAGRGPLTPVGADERERTAGGAVPPGIFCVAVAEEEDGREEEEEGGGDGSAPDDADALRDLLRESCTYREGVGFKEAAARREQQLKAPAPEGRAGDDPTLLGVPSKTISSGLRRGAAGVAWGIVAAATLLGRGIRNGTELAVERGWIASSEDLGEPEHAVDPRVRCALQASKQVTSTVHRTAEDVACAVGAATWFAAAKAAEALPPDAGDASSSAVSEVASATIFSLGEVVDALEAAAVGLYQASVESTSRALQHRYGDEAAASAVDALACGGHMVGAALSVRLVGKRRLIKTFANKALETAVLSSEGAEAGAAALAAPSLHSRLEAATPGPVAEGDPGPLPAVATAGAGAGEDSTCAGARKAPGVAPNSPAAK